MNDSQRPFIARSLVVIFAFATAFTSPAFAANWKEQVLYSFQGGTDGIQPGGVIFDKQRNIYGVTAQGGSDSCPPAQCGTVFELSPPTQQGNPWTEAVLYVFKGHASGDGAGPYGGLIRDASNNLYGTTGYGGTGSCVLLGTAVGCGTVYQMKPPSKSGGAWTETVLYSFKGGDDGYLSGGSLVFDRDGNLYGATYYGGGFGVCNQGIYQHCGTIFELSPPKKKGGKWTEKVLCSFKGSGQDTLGDGANPNGGLVFDAHGALYGTTYFGGNQGCNADEGVGCGIVFKLSPPRKVNGKWQKEILYWFDGNPSGGNPSAGLVFGSDKNLYGTATAGGEGDPAEGVAFELVKPSKNGQLSKELLLHTFRVSPDGDEPEASLIFDGQGNMYSVDLGGRVFGGNVFELSPQKREAAWNFSVLYNFTGAPDGAGPKSSLIFDDAANLYSTTVAGGTGKACQYGCGTVFELTPQ